MNPSSSSLQPASDFAPFRRQRAASNIFKFFSPLFRPRRCLPKKKLQALERTRLPRSKIVEIIDVDVTDSGSCRRGLRTRWVLCPVLSRTAFEIGSDEADVFTQLVVQISNPDS